MPGDLDVGQLIGGGRDPADGAHLPPGQPARPERLRRQRQRPERLGDSKSLQRKIVKPQDSPDLDGLAQRLLAFHDRYNLSAEPFDWRYTRKSLNRPLERLAAHEAQAA